MVHIVYPPYQPRIKSENNKEFIFDPLRKRWTALTPEEWVRQHFIAYLTQVMQYPASLIAIEREISLPGLKKRFDIVVYNRDAQPWMIVECKEMNVPLNAAVLDQVLRYNQAMQVSYLVITNGNECYAFAGKEGKLEELGELPSFAE